MRYNFFNDPIFQPDDEVGDIDSALIDRFSIAVDFTAARADLWTNGDEQFKFGGEFFFVELDEPVSFDGFESVDAARTWLLGLGIPEHNIEEVDLG